MSTAPEQTSFDIACIGFGPAALAVAISFIDKRRKLVSAGLTPPWSSICFIEKHTQFSWHPGMLLPGSSMQISFLKDLATLRDPSSPYTFLSYLHEHGRLITYINRGSFIPSRREYFDYLTWASLKIREEEGVNVYFSEEVLGIAKTSLDNDLTEGFLIHSRDVSPSNGTETLHARTSRNLIIAPGGSPRLPPSLAHLFPSPQILHTSQYALQVDRIMATLASSIPTLARPLRIAVVGSGQSAAECLLNLQERLFSIPLPEGATSGHSVELIIRRGSLKPSDDSPFANEIFDPQSTDFMYNLPGAEERGEVRREYESTNYGVVNPKTIDRIYEVVYDQKIEEAALARGRPSASALHPRLDILPYRSIVGATSSPVSSSSTNVFTFALRPILNNGPEEERIYDAIVVGTGYERRSWLKLLDAEDFGAEYGFSSTTPTVPVPHSSSEATAHEVAVASEKETIIPIAVEGEDAKEPISPPLTASVIDPAERTPSSLSSRSDSASTDVSPAPSASASDSESTSAESVLAEHESKEEHEQAVHVVEEGDGEEEEEEAQSFSPLQRIKISRAYRLLPVVGAGEKSRPRIYVQGIAEETHGMSDTLLSVLSVRSGEVVDDLFDA